MSLQNLLYFVQGNNACQMMRHSGWQFFFFFDICAEDMHYRYRYRVLPGLQIVSRTHWTPMKILGLCLVLVIVVFLATRSKEGRSLMDSALSGADKTSKGAAQIGGHSRTQANFKSVHQPHRFSPEARVHPARKRSLPKRRRLTKRQRRSLLHRFNYCCNACQVPLDDYSFDADHHAPLWLTYLGADPDRLQTMEKFVALCTPCHRKKTQRENSSPLFREAMRRKRLYFR